MSGQNNNNLPSEEPIKPIEPSEKPGTSIGKGFDGGEEPIKPEKPSEKAGTSIPLSEPGKSRNEN